MTKRILIVEDSSLMLAIISNFIKKMNIDVEIDKATSGESAIEKYQTKSYDLVFMDILMPGMDGLTALEKIKKIDKYAKVVMCTSLKEKDQEERAKNAGCVGYIMKPFTSNDIQDAIKKNL